MLASRPSAFILLALASLLWSGNWVTGRALRDAFDPVALNFWRWLIAALLLAPFALAGVAAKGALLRRRAGILLLLAFLGVALFQSLVYLGLRSTTAVNGVLLNSSAPLFMLIWSWVLERERATLRQLAGMFVSLAGILVIISHGNLAGLLELRFQAGDAWLLLAMPVWGLYSVLLKRRPPDLGGVEFLFVIAVAGTLLLLPIYAIQWSSAPPRWPAPAEALGVLYIAVAASVIAFIFWNRGVAVLGAVTAGFTLHLLPAFGTVLAIVFLGETFGVYHATGIATIVAGVLLATARAPESGKTPEST